MNSTTATQNKDGVPPEPEIRKELERIISSSEFAKSDQLILLLRHMADKTLAGKADELTQKWIATEVLGREFDDPIVKSEMQRIKLKLEKYYKKAGKHSPIRITKAKHGYKLDFQYNKPGGKAESPKSFREWRYSDLEDLLLRTERDPEAKEDLRIVTSGFSGSVQDLRLFKLLKRNVRVRILLINPKNRLLMTARHGKRDDTSIKGATTMLKGQIKDLESLRESSTNGPLLEWRLSDAMPFSFVAHTNKWALIGFFLCKQTFSEGPFLEISSNASLWETLRNDWQDRWDDAAPGGTSS